MHFLEDGGEGRGQGMCLAGVGVWWGQWELDCHPVSKQTPLDLSACGIVWAALKKFSCQVFV